MEAGFHVEHVFSTPVIVDHLPDAESLNAELETLILERRAVDPGIQRSNAGGWHSALDLLHWGGEPARRVAVRTVELADAMTLDTEAAEGERRGWLLEAWANVNESGAGNAPHYHGASYWSAVYYVRAGEGEGEGGELVLHDPRFPYLDMHAPDLRFRDSGGEQLIHTSPRSGMLILFPSWLTHSVAPWRGEGQRISIAINLSAAPRAARPG
jgi:uncharacterized protein (TIGR02466 family)